MQTRQSIQCVTTLHYWLHLPEGYAQGGPTGSRGSWPLLIFLHGAGERGDDLERVKLHGIPRVVDEGMDLPMVAASPQCPADSWWSLELRALDALLDALLADYQIDPRRIYLTGLSMGGFGTWSWALRRPSVFAALAPICGGLDGPPSAVRMVERLKDVPIWAFHGARDPVVPLEAQTRPVEELRRLGGPARLTVYPEAEHDSWTVTYGNPELYAWMLAQSRPGAQPG